MKTLNELLIENGHEKEKNMILKMDIEGSEWDVLNEISEEILNQFKYILLELHFRDNNKYEFYYNAVKKVVKNHQAYHIHCSNCGKKFFIIGANPLCRGFEIFFIKKEGYKFRRDSSTYPIKGFDFKTCPNKPYSNNEKNVLKYCNE